MKKIFKVLLMLVLPVLSLAGQKELREKIEYLIMPDFRYWQMSGETEKKDFDTMNDEVKEVIKSHNFNGVILFAQNVKEIKQTVKLVDELQKASKKPMLISIDQEGGIVTRLGTGTNFPGNMAIGATRNSKYSYMVGKAIGSELHSLGINVNLAPVIDTNNNPKNPVIGLRSFSSDPNIVSEMGIPMIKGMQEEKIIAVGKHFPGHGDTATDTHLGLAVVDKSYDELSKTEFVPFKKAIDSGIDMIMTAHVQLPQIEKDYFISKTGDKITYPSTISDDVITGILRNKMKFNGVVITDALGMKAISDNLGPVEAMKLSINAGVDILLMPISLHSLKNVEELDKAIDKLVEMVEKGEISEKRIDESIKRINDLKVKRNVLKDTRNIDSKISEAIKVIGSKENRALERLVSKEAITTIKNVNKEIPKKVLILTLDENQNKVTDFAITRLVREDKIKSVEYGLFKYDATTNLDTLKEYILNAKYDTVIVYGSMINATTLSKDNYRTKLADEIAKLDNINKIYVSLNKPYDVAAHLDYDKVLIAYGFKGMDPTEVDAGIKAFGPNIPAVLEVIFEGGEGKGKLPVDIPVIKDGKLTSETMFKITK